MREAWGSVLQRYPFFSQKALYTRQRGLHIRQKAPQIRQKSNILIKKAYISAKEPYTSTKEPCITELNERAIIWKNTLKMLHPQNPPNVQTQIFRYKLIFSQNLNFEFVPRDTEESEVVDLVDFEMWHFQWKLSYQSNSKVSFAEYRLFYRALLQKRPIILKSLLIVASA